MDIQIISDLYIDLKNDDDINKIYNNIKTNYIALLGNIAKVNNTTYYNFLELLSKKYKKVFIVFGNYEFYENEYYDMLNNIKNFCSKYDNLIFLNNNEYILSINNIQYHILGLTLWNYNNARLLPSIYSQDYNNIKINDNNNSNIRLITTEDTDKFYTESTNWLNNKIKSINELNNNSNVQHKIIVFTYNTPIIIINNNIYMMIKDIDYSLITSWVYGNKKWTNDFIKDKTRIVSSKNIISIY